ncbi:hypothetical protein HYFRA_00002139 [Hymenoscyphus fraxineus]|uniref:Major facilitator superfamily (MFS) profile domain-containing protein n=1 Tax=Hymenoscyphus fraxineus TaxID=746836 RepID=A0A9N9PJT2_9HELO|nr:hypothetical protein HYFRA_00002139 [Hymenoscyphus fraxineus]
MMESMENKTPAHISIQSPLSPLTPPSSSDSFAAPAKTEPENLTRPEKKSLSFKLAYASVMTSAFISTMDTVIVATALPAIALDLNAHSNSAYWMGSGFLFAQAVSQPLYGSLSMVFGRKDCLIFAMVLFTVSSLFCALAQSARWLIIARVFQGLGAGGINVTGSIIITDMVPLRERGKYIGILSLASALGLMSGILMGAAIAGRATWRLIFYINLPLCIPATAGIYFFLHLSAEPLSIREKLKRKDWIGITVLTGSLISLLYGVTSGGVLHPWNSVSVILSIAIGVIGVTFFVFYEQKFAKEPMIPLRIFASRTAGVSYLSSFCLGFVLWATQYYLIQYFLTTQRHSLVGAGVAILPGTIVIPIMAAAGGIFISKLQKFRTVNSVSWMIVTIGFSLMTQLKIDSSKAMQFGFQIIWGFGSGILFPGRQVAVQAVQTDEDVPMATAMTSFITSLGQSFGVGIGGVVFQNQWSKHVQSAVSAGTIPPEYKLSYHQAEQAAALIQSFPSKVQIVYRVIMADVIDTLFIVLAGFSAVAFLASLASKNLSLDRETKSAQQFREREKPEREDN